MSASTIACHLSIPATDQDGPPKDSIATPQQDSNIKDAAVARTIQFVDFHLEQSLEIEVLTAMLSRRMMHHGTIVTGYGLDRVRLSSENPHILTTILFLPGAEETDDYHDHRHWPKTLRKATRRPKADTS